MRTDRMMAAAARRGRRKFPVSPLSPDLVLHLQLSYSRKGYQSFHMHISDIDIRIPLTAYSYTH